MEGREGLLFRQKEAKSFGERCRGSIRRVRDSRTKVFWFFFSKKNRLPSLYQPQRSRRQRRGRAACGVQAMAGARNTDRQEDFLTSVGMIENDAAVHPNTTLDAAAIDVREAQRKRTKAVQDEGVI